MNKLTLATAAVFFFSGCQTNRTENFAIIPVAEKIDTKEIKKPTLDIAAISEKDTSAEIIKKYVISLNQAVSYAKQNEEVLDAYDQ